MKGIDYVIKKTASQLNFPEAEVKKVVMEYWETIYKRLLSLEQTTITARHIGSFTISRYKLNNFITKTISDIRKYVPKNGVALIISEEQSETLARHRKRLQTACKRRDEIAVMFKESKAATKQIKKLKEQKKNERS